MNKKLAIGLFIILPVLVGLIVLNEKRPGWEYNNAEREMRKQLANAHLIGNTPQEVIAYLDQHNFVHTEYSRKEDIMDDLKPRTLRVEIGPVARGFSFRLGPFILDMAIVFHFDKKDQLQSYEFVQSINAL